MYSNIRIQPSGSIFPSRWKQRCFGGRVQAHATSSKKIVLYTKPDCPLCDGLKDKLTGVFARSQFMPSLLSSYVLEVRDVSQNEEWSAAHASEVPVLAVEENGVQAMLPRPMPRITADRLQKNLEKALMDADQGAGTGQ